jgi:hypothetical protein
MVIIIVSVNCDEVLGQLICFYLVEGIFCVLGWHLSSCSCNPGGTFWGHAYQTTWHHITEAAILIFTAMTA